MRNRKKQDYFTDDANAPAPLEFTVRHRVYFNETDALGIVWHGNYAVFFEQAITELAHSIGLSVTALKDAGLATPLAQLHIDYGSPLYIDETVDITVRLHWSDGPLLNYDLKAVKPDGTLVCTGYEVQVFMDLQNRQALWYSPDIWENCKKRWAAGEFYHG